MATDTITGVLHGTVTPKRRGGLFDQWLVAALTESGRISYDDRRFYYAPSYWLSPIDGDRYIWKVPDRSKLADALSLRMLGHEITVRAVVQPWSNGFGAKLLRGEIAQVSDAPVVHECNNRTKGPCTPLAALEGETDGA